MTELAVVTQPKPALVAGGGIKPIIPQTMEEAFRLAKAVAAAGWAPKGYEQNETKIAIGILHGLEVGLSPMAALQSIAVINGTPTIWGDGALALIQSSGLLEDHDERVDPDPKNGGYIARVMMKRRGRATPNIQVFSTEDAKRAGLLAKDTWQKYPQRMPVMRARAWVMRNLFADCLRGLAIREEVQDMIDINPPAPNSTSSGITIDASSGGESAGGPTHSQLAPYPAEKFAENLPKWRKLIADGKKTAEQIVAMVSSKNALTDDQRTLIEHPPLSLEELEQIGAKASAVAIADSDIAKHFGVASIADLVGPLIPAVLAFIDNPAGD